MKKISLLILLIVFFFSLSHAANEYGGDWYRVDSNSDNCDFIGDAILVINYRHAKIKAKNWRLDDSGGVITKIFKGKIKNNNSEITMQSFGVGYMHQLIGKIDNNKIVINFSSDLKMADKKFGGCTFIFSRDPSNYNATESEITTTDTTTQTKSSDFNVTESEITTKDTTTQSIESNEKERNVIEEKLNKLKFLYEQELITKDEYDQKRKEILDKI